MTAAPCKPHRTTDYYQHMRPPTFGSLPPNAVNSRGSLEHASTRADCADMCSTDRTAGTAIVQA
jgi:hypothetical protein